jgi:hypothetical protein
MYRSKTVIGAPLRLVQSRTKNMIETFLHEENILGAGVMGRFMVTVFELKN